MKQETIIVRPGSGEIKIFFNENLYDVTKEKLVVEIDARKLNGTIVGANLDYLDSGIITLIYNPTKPNMGAPRAEASARDIVEFIESCTVES